MKVLISKKTGNYYYYNESSGQDLHTKEGFVKKDDLLSGERKVETNTGREFLVFEANNYDYISKYKRGPQIITPKDLGYVLTRTGIDRKSLIIEAGGGSGAATIFFARFVEKVKSYEVRADNCKIIQKNLDLCNINNVELTEGDLGDFIEKEDSESVDLLFLDMPNHVEIMEKNLSCVKNGHYIVCYAPSISQIQEITKCIAESEDMYLEEICEINKRNWRVWDRVSRPEFRKEIDHTAFLVFVRKI